MAWHETGMRDAKVLRYADHFSTLALWWKSFLLVPIWAIPLIPIIGGITSRVNDGVVQVTYTFLLGLLLARLVEDILKCKIRIDQDILFFGFRSYQLNDLASVGLQYKENQVLPRLIVLNFRSGRKLKLKISRLRNEDAETLLKYIETTHPEAKIDPVLRTLSKCKKLARNSALETENAVEIPYASRRIFRQLLDTFMGTAEKWMRVGPLIMAVVAMPVWLGFFSNIFTMMSTSSWELTRNLVMKKGLDKLIEQFHGEASRQISSLNDVFLAIVANPIVTGLLMVSLITSLYYLGRLFFRPNVIMLDESSIRLQLRVFSFSMNIGQVNYDSITNAYLEKSKNSANAENWKMIFNRTNGQAPFELSLGAITPENRVRFAKAFARLAPDCAVDSELAEAMMPRQERSYTELWLQSLSAPPERKSLEPLSAGQRLHGDQYEVLRKLGVGGQGLAYLCQDVAEKQNIVLKETILPIFVEPTVRQQALERFQAEAELLNKLDSDGIVKLVDYFVEDHRGYLVLEHIDGKTLRQLIEERGALSEAETRELAAQMCQILSYLHKHGIIHRDFTPDNLILRNDGKLKLIDFNVAQQAEDGATGTIVGKHSFLPPEQFRGKPTFQSDIYAMGATLFFLTTQRDPEPITKSRPSSVGIDLSAELDDFIAQCTELNCSKRITDADTALRILFADATENNESVVLSTTVEEKEHIAI